MIDADNQPLVDPAMFFDDPGYRATGCLFWPDWWPAATWVHPVAYQLFGLEAPWQVGPGFMTTESGEIVIDRCGSKTSSAGHRCSSKARSA